MALAGSPIFSALSAGGARGTPRAGHRPGTIPGAASRRRAGAGRGLLPGCGHQAAWGTPAGRPARAARLISIELIKQTPGKLWSRLMKDERNSNRPARGRVVPLELEDVPSREARRRGGSVCEALWEAVQTAGSFVKAVCCDVDSEAQGHAISKIERVADGSLVPGEIYLEAAVCGYSDESYERWAEQQRVSWGGTCAGRNAKTAGASASSAATLRSTWTSSSFWILTLSAPTSGRARALGWSLGLSVVEPAEPQQPRLVCYGSYPLGAIESTVTRRRRPVQDAGQCYDDVMTTRRDSLDEVLAGPMDASWALQVGAAKAKSSLAWHVCALAQVLAGPIASWAATSAEARAQSSLAWHVCAGEECEINLDAQGQDWAPPSPEFARHGVSEVSVLPEIFGALWGSRSHGVASGVCLDRLLETVNFLHPGTGFGDLALQSDEPRRATVVCSESSEFLVITRADYQSYADARHREFLSERVEFLRSCPCIRDALLASSVTEAEVAVMANLLHEVCLHGHVIACKQGDEVSEVIFVRSGQLLKIRAVDVAAAGSIAGNPRSPSQADQAKMQELFTVKRTARRTSAMEKLDTDMLDPQSKSSAGSKEQAQPRQPGQAPAAAASKWAHLEKHANKPDAIETSSEAPTTAGNGGRHMLLSVGFVGPFERFGDRELFLGERHAVSLISNPVAKLYTMKRHDILKLPKRLLSELFGQQALCLPDDRQLLAMYRRGKKWDHFRKGVHVQHRRGVDADSNLEFLGASGGAADVDRASDRRPPADSRRVGLTLEEAEDFSQSPASFLHRFHGMSPDQPPSTREGPAGKDTRNKAGQRQWAA
ncbi:unnamed protein product [Prorocentrum cordatum]|uniref:Cyclic nucleotide-binding domain-containing protein n=1 Tax=Prorocentrum cordatum TaxID=2364126 RepID=A0ABN9Y2C8_9DINO|nr:unnamed protein product [Polarella glacialis]